jgi:hypothetical protein
LKIQHALRAFTAADRRSIRQTADNYPETQFYKTEDLITHLGIGEALVTILDEKGIPTPLVHCMIRPPRSRMDILSEAEMDELVNRSRLAAKYNQAIDSVSASEMLTDKLKEAELRAQEQRQEEQRDTEEKKQRRASTTSREKGVWDDPVVKSMTRTAGNTLVRSLLGVLGLGGRSRRRRSLF